jgi:chromosome segregation ATPase
MLFFVLYLVLHYLMSVSVPKMDKFEQILDRKLTQLLAKFDQLNDKVVDALSSLSFLSEKYEESKGKVSQLEENNKGLKKDYLFLNKELAKVTNDIKNLRELQDEFEQYGRRECLKIRGIPQLQGENTDEIIVKISSKVGVVIKEEDISISHRLPV